MKQAILFHTAACTGCRSCEMACGFHWTQQMDPARSSIEIYRNPETAEIRAEIADTCDVCCDLEVPLCIEVCAPRALSLGRRAV